MFPVQFKKTFLASAVMLGGLCTVAAGQTADTKVLSNHILPKDTYFYMSVPSVEGMKNTFQNSSAGRLWADSALEEFKAELQGALANEVEESFAKVYDALGLTVDELLAIPTGEVTIAFSKASNKMGAIVVVDYGSHESEVRSLLEKAAGALNNANDLEASNVEHDGTELTIYKITNDIAKQTPLAKEFGWFLKDERLVISNNSALLKLTLDNWAGDSEKTLVNNDVYAYIMEKCESTPGAGLATTYMDPVGLFNALIETGSLGQQGFAASMVFGSMQSFGINQFKGIGSSGEMGGEKFEGVSRAFLYSEQPPEAAMQIFQFSAVDAVPPSWVKENVSGWMATNWKVGEAYKAIEGLFDTIQGAGAMEGFIEKLASQGPRIHIKNDIVDQLNGNIQIVSAPADRASDAATDDMLFVIGIKDNETFSDVLNKLTSEASFPGESREINGTTVYEIAAPGGQKFSFTVANGHLMIAVGEGQLEQALRNNDDVRPLSESDDFKAVGEHFPSGALAVTFSRPAQQYRSLYEKLRDGEAAESFPGMEDMFSKIDFSKLPPFEVIEKYIAPAGGYWLGDENGVLIEQFSLKSE